MVGSLRNIITLYEYTRTPNDSGGSSATYGRISDFWAKVRPLAGSRGIEASAIELEQVYEIWMRYEDYPPLNKKILIKFENRTLTINAFQIIEEKRKFFKIIAKEDAGRDNIIFDENYQPITDENGNYITT